MEKVQDLLHQDQLSHLLLPPVADKLINKVVSELIKCFDTHNQTSVSPLTMKFTAEPIPVPCASGAVISTVRLSLSVITIGYVVSKNVVSFGATSILKNLCAVIP